LVRILFSVNLNIIIFLENSRIEKVVGKWYILTHIFNIIGSSKRTIYRMIPNSQNAATSDAKNNSSTTLKLNLSRQTSFKRRNSENDDQVRQ